MNFSFLLKLRDIPSYKKYFINTSWLLSERVFRIGITAIVGILLVRHLQPESYGKLSFAMSFMGLFTAFSTLGLDAIVINNLVDKKNKAHSLLGTAFILKLIGSLFSVALIIGIQFFSNLDFSTKLLTSIVSSSLVLQSFSVIDFYFQAKVQAKFTVISQLVSISLSSLLKLIFIVINAPLYYFGIVYVVEIALFVICLLIAAYRQRIFIHTWRFEKVLAIRLLKNSWPLVLSSIMVSLYMKIDQVMITSLLSTTQTGLYSAAVNLSEVWYFIPVAITSSFYPALISAKRDQKLFEKRIAQLNSLLVLMAIPAVIVVSIFSRLIITILYGETYLPAANVLSLHIWSAIFVFMGVLSSRWLIIEKLQIYSTIFTALGAVINISLNLYLIPTMGIIGAAWATFFSYMFTGSLCFLLFPKTRRYFYLQLNSVNPSTMLKTAYAYVFKHSRRA